MAPSLVSKHIVDCDHHRRRVCLCGGAVRYYQRYNLGLSVWNCQRALCMLGNVAVVVIGGFQGGEKLTRCLSRALSPIFEFVASSHAVMSQYLHLVQGRIGCTCGECNFSCRLLSHKVLDPQRSIFSHLAVASERSEPNTQNNSSCTRFLSKLVTVESVFVRTLLLKARHVLQRCRSSSSRATRPRI